ncbi:MAG: hypothetical protein R6V35_01115 [Candidatus Nanohaloarchaea archaeon]
MGDSEKVRDWEVNEAIFDLQHDSYDFVGRDLPLNNGLDADILRYRLQNYRAEAGFFYSGQKERSEAMANLEAAREVLEGHSPRLYLVDADSARTGYDIELEGNYVWDFDANVRELRLHIEDFMRIDFDSPEIEPVRCKR